jgi:hypothetical protein
VRLRITNPEKASDINTAIEYLGKSLSTTTISDRTDYKNKFDSIYFKFAEQPQQQKPVVTPPGDNNQPSPDNQKPDPDKDKNITDQQKLATGIVAATIAETSSEETAEIAEKVVEEVAEVIEAAAEKVINSPGIEETTTGAEAVIAESSEVEVAESVTLESETNVAKELTENKIDFFKNNIKHIFRDAEGHLQDTPANRQKILEMANDQQNYFPELDARGNLWCAKTLDDGSQLWASIRNGQIRNAGLNPIPISWNNITGLCENIIKK